MSHTITRTEVHWIELPDEDRFEYHSQYRKAANIVYALSARVVDGALQSVTLHNQMVKKDGTLGLVHFTDTVWKPYSADVVAVLKRYGVTP